MKKVILITCEQFKDDETSGIISVSNDESCDSIIQFKNFEIEYQEDGTDCEDFNDNARWLAKTLLEILKMEHNDENAHCDWSADSDANPITGRYKFSVKIKKVREDEKY